MSWKEEDGASRIKQLAIAGMHPFVSKQPPSTSPYDKFDAELLLVLSRQESSSKHAVLVVFRQSNIAAHDLAVAYVLRSVGPRSYAGELTEPELKLLAGHDEVSYIKLIEPLTSAEAHFPPWPPVAKVLTLPSRDE
jgi:hypothetical protein